MTKRDSARSTVANAVVVTQVRRFRLTAVGHVTPRNRNSERRHHAPPKKMSCIQVAPPRGVNVIAERTMRFQ